MPVSDSSEEKLKKFFLDRAFTATSEIRKSYAPGIDFAVFIPVDKVGPQAKKGLTSKLQLSSLEQRIREELGLVVQWIIIPSEKHNAIETALRDLIEKRFPNAFTSVFISSPTILPVTVWLVPGENPSIRHDLQSAEIIVKEFLGLFQIQEVSFIAEVEPTATIPMILRKLKLFAPQSIDGLAAIFAQDGINVPNQWLHSKLDTLRKQGLVVWANETGRYALTEQGVRLVPHGRNRKSSDIERALALGRLKW